DDVKIFSVRVKRQVAWASAGMDFSEGLRRGLEFAVERIEPVDHHLVVAEIRGEGETIRPVKLDAVRVRSFLLLAWAGAFMLFDVDGRTKTTVTQDRQHRDVAARVLRHE